MIEICGLNKKFGKLQVLKDLDLCIGKGGIISILGPNGAGKTTLIKCVLGMVVPDNGQIQIKGENVVGEW